MRPRPALLFLLAVPLLAGCAVIPLTGAPTTDTAVVVVRPGIDVSSVVPTVEDLAFLPADAYLEGFPFSTSPRGQADVEVNEGACSEVLAPYIPAPVLQSYSWTYASKAERFQINVSAIEVYSPEDAAAAVSAFRVVMDNCVRSTAGETFAGTGDSAGFTRDTKGMVISAIGPYLVQAFFNPSHVERDDAWEILSQVRDAFESGSASGTIAAPGSGAPEWVPVCADGTEPSTAARTSTGVLALCDDYSMVYQDDTSGRSDSFPDAGGVGGQICGNSDDGFEVCSDFETFVSFPSTGEASQDVLEFWYRAG